MLCYHQWCLSILINQVDIDKATMVFKLFKEVQMVVSANEVDYALLFP